MNVPRHWARVSEGERTALGWSEQDPAEAERMARERLARLLALGDGLPREWDYYPARAVKEEILEAPRIAEVTVLITRNGAGAEVLNTDRVAFVDIDVHERPSLLGSIGSLFRKRAPGPDPRETEALARARGWVAESRARLRVYRTAGGLRLLRTDALLDPAGDDCARMFAALGADPQYARLCKAQQSFRARLTPKPRRVKCSAAPFDHPRTDPAARAAFARWLERYERACADRAVCAFVEELGVARALAPAQAVAALHDQRTLRAGALLA